MKLITAIIQPHKLDDVKEAHRGRRRARSDRVRGQAATAASAATPRSTVALNTLWT